MQIKKIFIIILLINVLLITGCWNKIELDEEAIVSGVGFDLAEDNQVQLSTQLVLHRELNIQSRSGKRGENKPTQTIISKGNSIYNAARNFMLQAGRLGFWAHAKIFVLGEEFAKNGIDPFIDVMERDPEIRRRTHLLVAEGDAKSIMEAKIVDLEVIQAFNISDVVDSYSSTSYIVSVDLHQYLLMSTREHNTSAYMTGIHIVHKDESEKSKEEFNENEIELKNTGIFKENKLVGWFNDNETNGLLWIKGDVKNSIIDLKEAETQKYTTVYILRARSRIKAELVEDQVKMTIEVSVIGNIGETTEDLDFSKEENFKKIEKRMQTFIKSQITESIDKGKKLNTDIFDFDGAVYRKYPKKWENLKAEWDEIFPQIEVEIIVKPTIQRSGLITNHKK